MSGPSAIAFARAMVYSSLMIRGLLDPIRTILQDLQDLTGKEVHYVHKPDLKSLARMHMAGDLVTSHTLFYRDEANPLINHVVANECAHLIRIFRAPEGKRRLAVANENTMARYREEIRGEIQKLSLIHGLDTLRSFIPLWYEAVVFQVTRMPTDIMIERWLCEQYPAVRDLQRMALREQYEKAISVLSVNVRRMTPGKVYDVSQIMNYVFFKITGELLGIHLIAPYEKSRYRLPGEELASWTAEHYSEDHERDIRVIDYWARYLELADWIEWRRFDEVSHDTLH
ncbi:MAG TPA: hypothetical protein VMB77_13255 [Syntrophales bacterium]|nr:hypothetical protein [Syntrophales bacterium]